MLIKYLQKEKVTLFVDTFFWFRYIAGSVLSLLLPHRLAAIRSGEIPTVRRSRRKESPLVVARGCARNSGDSLSHQSGWWTSLDGGGARRGLWTEAIKAQGELETTHVFWFCLFSEWQTKTKYSIILNRVIRINDENYEDNHRKVSYTVRHRMVVH